MSKHKPLAKGLIMESNKDDFREVLARSNELEESPWITYIRSVAVNENLQNTLWTVEWSLKDILYDLNLFKD
ncbi:hypothetical protein WAI453_009234 [Rhynchosporium graminicola]